MLINKKSQFSNLLVSSTTIDGNLSNFTGAGLSILGGTVSLIGVNITNNYAYGTKKTYGGGIYARNTTLSIKNSLFSNNSADFGGSMYSFYSNVTITFSEFTKSIASQLGGAIFSGNGLLIANQSTVSASSATYGGSAIFVSIGSATLNYLTLSNLNDLNGGLGLLNADVTLNQNTFQNVKGVSIYCTASTITPTNVFQYNHFQNNSGENFVCLSCTPCFGNINTTKTY